MYMLIIVDIIDMFFLFTENHCRETLWKEEETKGIYTPDGCSECFFYVQLSCILNFQTLLVLENISLVAWLINIATDLQSWEMKNGHGQRKQASESGKKKRKLEFWCIILGQICTFVCKRKLEFRGAV